MFKSHEPVVDVPHVLLENRPLPHEGFFFAEPAKSEASTLDIFCYKQESRYLQSQDTSKLEGAPKKPWEFLVDGEIKNPLTREFWDS